MKTSDFYYDLPERLIAQTPIEPRSASRMMVCNRKNNAIDHKHFYDLPSLLNKGDVLVINQSKVIPARLLGEKENTKVPIEILLLKRLEQDIWEALVKPGRRLKKGAACIFGNGLLKAEVLDTVEEIGGRQVRFIYDGLFENILDTLGEMPLPPYIHEQLEDKNRYQTVYAKQAGSAAAPTAGLHFTTQLLEEIQAMGVQIVPILLHVGLGTFRPVKEDRVENHIMHKEYYEITPEAADAINRVRKNGGRCICVGTTSIRTLESVVDEEGMIHPGRGETNIFITPGKKIRSADALITNFHLPESTLLMLISAFWNREAVLKAYEEAVKEEYRFFSFGDCMFLC